MMYSTPMKTSTSQHSGTSSTLRQTPSSALSSRSSSTSSRSSSPPSPPYSAPTTFLATTTGTGTTTSPSPSMRYASPRTARILTTKTTTTNHHSHHNNSNLTNECLRLLTKSNKLLLGIASLLVTWLLTASPYERMALEESITRNYDIPNTVIDHYPHDYHHHHHYPQQQQQQQQQQHDRAKSGLPDNFLLPHNSLRQRNNNKNREDEDSKPQQPHQSPKSSSLVVLKPEPFLPIGLTQVHFLADATTPDRTSKFILDGLERSQQLEITAISIAQLHATERQLATLQVFDRNASLPLLYIVDWGSMDRDCGLLQKMLETTTIKFTDSLVLVDFSASFKHSKCFFLDNYKKVKYTKRSVVEQRHYDTTFGWIDPGRIVENTQEGDAATTTKVHFAPLVLRESFVDLMHNVTTAAATAATATVTTTTTTNDLILFNWKPGDNSHYGFLRRQVADKVQSLGGNVTSFASSDEQYVQAMLQSKMVILAQRDEWEGHYRLLEAMASGALVLTDPMLAMPPHFKNGTNLLVYRDLSELKRYVRYFASAKHEKKRQKIAKKGYETVMGRHRTWHRMEEIIFGKALTAVDQLDAEAPHKKERPELKLVEHS